MKGESKAVVVNSWRMTRYRAAEWQDERQKVDRGYQGESRESERMDIVTIELDNIQKSSVLLSFWRKIVTKVEVKQRKFASCLIEKRGGSSRAGLMEKAGTLSSLSSPALYKSLCKWAVEEIKMNLHFTSTFFFFTERKVDQLFIKKKGVSMIAFIL